LASKRPFHLGSWKAASISSAADNPHANKLMVHMLAALPNMSASRSARTKDALNGGQRRGNQAWSAMAADRLAPASEQRQ